MSTSYFMLRSPVTKVRVYKGGAHTDIIMWTTGGRSGTLTVMNEDAAAMLELFFDCDVCPAPMHSHSPEGHGIPDDTWLLSEYGELLTAREIRAKHGRRR